MVYTKHGYLKMPSAHLAPNQTATSLSLKQIVPIGMHFVFIVFLYYLASAAFFTNLCNTLLSQVF